MRLKLHNFTSPKHNDIVILCILLVTDVIGFVSVPDVMCEEDVEAQVLLGALNADGTFNNGTVALLNIENESEGKIASKRRYSGTSHIEPCSDISLIQTRPDPNEYLDMQVLYCSCVGVLFSLKAYNLAVAQSRL